MTKESSKPSYNLMRIKSAFKEVEDLRMTTSARKTQFKLGFSDQDVIDAIQGITYKEFYKTMSPICLRFTAWQDVYKTNFRGRKLYIKFQVNNNKELIVSFKENTERG